MKSVPESSRPTRHYDSSRRQGDADERRHRVITVATDLFLEQGYGSVTIQQIADAANVSAQMVYAAFGSKAGILGRAVDLALSGGEEVAVFDGAEVQSIFTNDEPRAFVRAIAAAGRVVHERSARILHLVDTVAGSDPAVEELRLHYEEAQRIDAERIIVAAPPTGRRDDLGVDETIDLLGLVGGPSGYTTLVHERAWSPERYEAAMEEFFFRILYEP